MSWNPAIEPKCPNTETMDSIETVIIPRARDIGDFEVRRALPSPRRQMVGPFVFFDQMGPAEFITDQGIDVRPHPHIGLATVTYLYKGEFQHQDSLGTDQMIYPGEVNWMIAGNGITHSERTSAETRKGPSNLFGIQTWVALPEHAKEIDADFEHHGKEALPLIEGEGKQVRLIIGDAWGQQAPTKTFTEMFYADAILEIGALLPMPDNHEDRGLYVTDGSIEIAGARLMLLGGETLNGPRHIWWNFVASSQEKIEAAKEAWASADWEHGRFHLPPSDKDEFIPLPE